jgi:DNA invertase Pin-like site-specific DNA recombinase
MHTIMIVGYARVSTEEQRLDLQLQALKTIGCNRIYEDHGCSGYAFRRDGLDAALASLKPGGTLVVWRLDRLGRSLAGLVHLIDQLGKKRVQFRSVMENIDTTSPGGRLMFHMMAALAEFERALISERTRAGLAQARVRGRTLGRPKALSEDQLREAFEAMQSHKMNMRDVANRFDISVRTLQRYLHRYMPDLYGEVPLLSNMQRDRCAPA